ncbi:MAG: glycosidase [Syntrophomonadaceae bacterium]
MTQVHPDTLFEQKMQEVIPYLSDYTNYDLVIGIPFINETETLPLLLQSLDQILESWIGRRQLIMCVGDYSAGPLLETIQGLKLKHPHISFLMPKEISGRGTCIKAMIHISKLLDADLLLFSANMATEEGAAVDSSWLESLLTPIQGHYDLVVGTLRRHLGIDSIAHILVSPILEAFYGFSIGDPLGGIYAISHDFIEELDHESRFWEKATRGHGIDFWILSRALSWNKNICEVNMAGRVSPHVLEVRNKIFYDNAHIIFEAIKRDNIIWLKDRLVVKVADIIQRSEVKRLDETVYSVPDLLMNFYQGCRKYDSVFQNGIGKFSELKKICQAPEENFYFPDEVWVSSVYSLLLDYAFREEGQHDVLSALTALYNGRVASYVLEMTSFRQKLGGIPREQKSELMVGKLVFIRQRLSKTFWHMKPELNRQWVQRSEQVKPAIIPLGYMEYVPGKPIVIPKKIAGKDNRLVQTDNIFKELRRRYTNKFNQFITEGLGLSETTRADEIIEQVKHFIEQIEMDLDRLLPGDLHSHAGLQQFVNGLMALFPCARMFTISDDLLKKIILRFPPINLMISSGCYRPEDLIENMDIRDAVTFANLIEGRSYSDRAFFWLVDNIKPESLEWTDIRPVILTQDQQCGILPHGKLSDLNRATARIAIRGLEPGRGGKYPKLRYLTNILRQLAVAENYSQLFRLNVSERKNVGLKIYNSLFGLHKGDDFSAYNILDNYNHRYLVEQVRCLAGQLDKKGHKDMARRFKLMADSYGLCHVLENEIFLTCTAWSWASYSFKGGLKIPTPSTTTVENRWFVHDFLELLYQELGYDPKDIKQIVFRFMQTGRSTFNLLDALLPTRPKDVDVVVQEITNEPSKHLVRYEENPILEPLEDSKWENKYVLNPGALRIDDKVYLFYRAVGDDNISRIGLAITDGYKVLKRLPEPIFSPEIPEEKMGCEDPRLVKIDDQALMLYTAYDGNIAQIAGASIKIDDLIKGNYTAWERKGLAFKNIWNKDAIILPEKVKGKYVVYHRIEPSIWVTYINELKLPIKERHSIIAGPRPGRMWDSLKIGAGAQPLKTKYGWLLIYHGVDYNYVYRLGVLLMDLRNPEKVIYRSPNPILEPEEDYEIGVDGAWVPNVVFTCGAVAGEEKDILEDEDEILVYYGAADTSIGVAKATLADLIPQSFRVNR